MFRDRHTSNNHFVIDIGTNNKFKNYKYHSKKEQTIVSNIENILIVYNWLTRCHFHVTFNIQQSINKTTRNPSSAATQRRWKSPKMNLNPTMAENEIKTNRNQIANIHLQQPTRPTRSRPASKGHHSNWMEQKPRTEQKVCFAFLNGQQKREGIVHLVDAI